MNNKKRKCLLKVNKKSDLKENGNGKTSKFKGRMLIHWLKKTINVERRRKSDLKCN